MKTLIAVLLLIVLLVSVLNVIFYKPSYQAAPENFMSTCLEAASLNAGMLPSDKSDAEYQREATNCAYDLAYGYNMQIANFEHTLSIGHWAY